MILQGRRRVGSKTIKNAQVTRAKTRARSTTKAIKVTKVTTKAKSTTKAILIKIEAMVTKAQKAEVIETNIQFVSSPMRIQHQQVPKIRETVSRFFD